MSLSLILATSQRFLNYVYLTTEEEQDTKKDTEYFGEIMGICCTIILNSSVHCEGKIKRNVVHVVTTRLCKVNVIVELSASGIPRLSFQEQHIFNPMIHVIF